jgi:hypothetical protein
MASGHNLVCILDSTSVAVAFGSVASVVVEGKRATQVQLPNELQAMTSMRFHSGARKLAIADIHGSVAIVKLDLVTPHLQQRGVHHSFFRPAWQLTDHHVRELMSKDAWSAEASHDLLVLEIPRVLEKLHAAVDCQPAEFSVADMMWAEEARLLHILLIKRKRGARPPHAAFCTWRLNENAS